jgi:hypothetical protein
MGAGTPGGLEWLANSDNLRYVTHDGKTQEMPLGDRENLIQQFDTYLNQQDKVRNAFYSDIHIRADTVAKVDKALLDLRNDKSLRNDSKYTWEQRFLEERRYLLAGGLTPAEAKSARDDMFKQQEDAVSGEIALYRLDHPNDLAGMQAIVTDKYRLHLIRGGFVQTELGKLQTEDAPSYKMGLSYLQDKAKGLPPEQTAAFASEFVKAYRSSKKELSNEDAIKIASNITGKYVVRAATDYLSLRDRTSEIAAGKVAGIEEANMPALEQTAAFAQKQAALEFPDEKLAPKDGGIAFVDSSGQYGGGIGASILMNAKHQPYGYKVVNNQLELYRLDHFTDAEMSVMAKGGIEYAWVPIKKIVQPKQPPAPATPAEVTAAVGAQPSSLGTPGQSVNIMGLGTFYLKDWEKKADGEWYSKSTGETASNIDPVISVSLDRLAKQAASK